MKSHAELKMALRRQWENKDLREARLSGTDSAWPLVMGIGRPSPSLIRTDLDSVKQHVNTWRHVRIGEVIWESVSYRATHAPVAIPATWILRKPSEWIDACGDQSIRQEFEIMATFVEQTESIFHSALIRRRSLWRGKPLAEVTLAAKLAMALEPGLAFGKPLRTLSLEGIDTKFFERHENLITTLLDIRFDGEASKIGLDAFLGALTETDHWVLLMDLDGSLLPFRKQRVRSSELQARVLPGNRLLIVENESCQHLIPSIPNTVAALGAGFDLNWISNSSIDKMRVAYWGDIDTWGLQFLSKARQMHGRLDALLMTEDVFNQFSSSAVPEPVTAGTEVPGFLEPKEKILYERLLNEPRGRLEQEFLSEEFICEKILAWVNSTPQGNPTF